MYYIGSTHFLPQRSPISLAQGEAVPFTWQCDRPEVPRPETFARDPGSKRHVQVRSAITIRCEKCYVPASARHLTAQPRNILAYATGMRPDATGDVERFQSILWTSYSYCPSTGSLLCPSPGAMRTSAANPAATYKRRRRGFE